MSFLEARLFHIKDGKRDQWVRLMEEKVIPFQVSKGVQFCGIFTAKEPDDVVVFVRRYESDEDRLAKYNAVYNTEYWQSLEPEIQSLVDFERETQLHLVPTALSVFR